MIKNISIVTLGCAKNEIDSELMGSILRDGGYKITNYLEEAHIIIVNTCGFILDAKEESIETILQVSKYKEHGKCEYLLLAGCLAERYSDELLEELHEVDGILGTGNIKDITTLIKELEANKGKKQLVNNVDADYLENISRTSFKPTEYVQISEGCNNYCSYCIIPKLRGKYRSRPMDKIIEEVEYLTKNGVKEIILIGQNTTDYGIDIYGEYKLANLLYKLNEIKGLQWIRLLYLYPDNFTEELITAIKENKKVVKYVDIPLQHINDNILKKMNRRTSRQEIEDLIFRLRTNIPNIIIRTTFIVGFPGETWDHFNELYEFIKETKFDRLGVFSYSREEGTAAYNFNNQIDNNIKEERKNKIMSLQQKISSQLNKQKIGKEFLVLIEEKYDNQTYFGRTYMDSPEVDGVVYINSNVDLELGQFVSVNITDSLEYDLIGEINNEPGK